MPKKAIGFRTKGKGRKSKVYPLTASTRKRSRSVASVLEIQRQRSKQAKIVDASLKAPIAESNEQWASAPNRYDLPKVDQGGLARQGTKKAQSKPLENGVASYNEATGWMWINFDSIPSPEARSLMKQDGFRYKPYGKYWTAKWTPERERLAKKIVGDYQTVNIKPNWAAKAEHAAELATKHENLSNQAYERSNKIADTIPFGQPILVGHHSEKHHRADIERIRNAMDKSVEEAKVAEKYQDRAERYGKKATGEDPGLIYRRIQKLEAEKRKMERRLSDPDYTRSKEAREHFTKWLNHYNSRLEIEREKYKASGGIAIEKTLFKPGDRVYTRYGVGTIASISQKTARVLIDPDPRSGHQPRIYANRKNQSLLPIEDIKEKLTPEQLQKYNQACGKA